jgi:hypothetical protein
MALKEAALKTTCSKTWAGGGLSTTNFNPAVAQGKWNLKKT